MANCIDLSYLIEISDNDSAFIKEMLNMYVNITAKDASQFNELLNKKDYNGIGNLAHKIKGPVQMLGYLDLLETLKDLEKIGKEAIQTKNYEVLVNQALEQVNQSILEIKEIEKNLI